MKNKKQQQRMSDNKNQSILRAKGERRKHFVWRGNGLACFWLIKEFYLHIMYERCNILPRVVCTVLMSKRWKKCKMSMAKKKRKKKMKREVRCRNMTLITHYLNHKGNGTYTHTHTLLTGKKWLEKGASAQCLPTVHWVSAMSATSTTMTTHCKNRSNNVE